MPSHGLFHLFVLYNFDEFVFVSSYYILFCYYFLETYLYSYERQTGGGTRWEERWVRVEGGESIIRTYHVREKKKKKLFSKKEKKNDNIWELDKNIISLPSDAG